VPVPAAAPPLPTVHPLMYVADPAPNTDTYTMMHTDIKIYNTTAHFPHNTLKYAFGQLVHGFGTVTIYQ